MAVPDLIAANNRFGFDLLARLRDGAPRQNLFISPASIALALVMTANGADVATARALRQVLRLGELTWPAVNQAQATLWQMLSDVDSQVTLALANSLWAEMGFPFASDFKEGVLRHYQAEIANLDFGDPETAAAVINRWVAEETRDKIEELVAPRHLIQAALVLVNAIYFKGMWAAPFDRADTQTGDFFLAGGGTQTVPMMQQSGKFHYLETAAFQLIALPFGRGRLSFTILLPAAERTLVDAAANLDVSTWTDYMARLLPPRPGPGQEWESLLLESGRSPGLIILPRFKIEYGQEILSPLKALGLTANSFPRLTDPPDPSLFISQVLHKTFLEVNEEGAEAAAATAVVMARSVAAPPFRMVVDRPFFCTIQDNLTGLILFMGEIYEPEE